LLRQFASEGCIYKRNGIVQNIVCEISWDYGSFIQLD